MIEIVLLGRPQGKGRGRVARDGHVYTPMKTREYEAALRYAAEQVMGDRLPLTGAIEVMIEVQVPIPVSWPKKKQEAARAKELFPTSKPDWDNFAKVVDALNLVVWADDSQIVDGRVSKRYSDKPGMWIRVYEKQTGVFG